MSVSEIKPPFEAFLGLDGKPLDAGYIYIGSVNLDPETNPISVYWDSALTVPASQPIRTLLGCTVRSGSPANVFVGSSYSITVKDSRGQIVYTSLSETNTLAEDLSDASDVAKGDALIAVKQPFTGAAARTQHDKNLDTVSVKDFGAVGDNTADDTAAFQVAVNSGVSIIYVPEGIYKLSGQIVIPRGVSLVGCGSKHGPYWNDAVSTSQWQFPGKHGTIFNITQGAGTTGKANAAFIMSSFSKIEGCIFWHSLQIAHNNAPATYPPTVALAASDPLEYSGKILSAQILGCTFLSSWRAIDATSWHEQLLVRDCYIASWLDGIVIDLGTDTDRLESIELNVNNVYQGTGGGWPPLGYGLMEYSQTNGGKALSIGRSDLIIIQSVLAVGYKYGLHLSTLTAGQSPSGVSVSQCDFEGQIYPIFMTGFVQNIVISDSVIQSLLPLVGSTIGAGIYIAGDVATLTGPILIRDVVQFSSSGPAILATYAQQLTVSGCTFGNIGLNQYSGTWTFCYAFNLANCNQVNIRDCRALINPNNTQNPLYGNLTSCTNTYLTDLYLYGQRAANNGFYCTTCTDVKILRIADEYSLMAPTLGQTGSTRCYGETALNKQGTFTPSLTGLGSATATGTFSESNGIVTVSIDISWGTPASVTQGSGVYLSGLPVTPTGNAALSAADTWNAISLGSAPLVRSSGRVFPPTASSQTRMTITGTYPVLP